MPSHFARFFLPSVSLSFLFGSASGGCAPSEPAREPYDVPACMAACDNLAKMSCAAGVSALDGSPCRAWMCDAEPICATAREDAVRWGQIARAGTCDEAKLATCKSKPLEETRPMFSLRLDQEMTPPLRDATRLEALLGKHPPEAVLVSVILSDISSTTLVPILATLPGRKRPKRAKIAIVSDAPSATWPPTPREDIVRALLENPPLTVSPTGHKWPSFSRAAPELLGLILRNGAEHVPENFSEGVSLYLDAPPRRLLVTFYAWTAVGP